MNEFLSASDPESVSRQRIPASARLSWMWRKRPHLWPATAKGSVRWPKLSIVIPSFNQGRFLEETIRSVLLQGYPSLELIVIDGGSKDDSVEVIRRYQDSITYWVSEKDRGQAHAVNKGLDQTTGEIIGWINSDDVYTADCFRRVIDAFVSDPELGLVHGCRILIDEDTTVCGCVPSIPFDPETTGYNIASETAFWRRSPANFRLKEDLRFAVDLDFFIRLSAATKTEHLDHFLGAFRCYGDNKSSTMLDVCMQETAERWQFFYGRGNAGWKNKQNISRLRLMAAFALHPQSIALPYLYRRIVLGRRGTTSVSS